MSLTSGVIQVRLNHTNAETYGGPLSASVITADRIFSTSYTLMPGSDNEYVTKYYAGSLIGGGSFFSRTGGGTIYPTTATDSISVVSGSFIFGPGQLTNSGLGYFENVFINVGFSPVGYEFYVDGIGYISGSLESRAISSLNYFWVPTTANYRLGNAIGGTVSASNNHIISGMVVSGGIVVSTGNLISLISLTSSSINYWTRNNGNSSLTPLTATDNLDLGGYVSTTGNGSFGSVWINASSGPIESFYTEGDSRTTGYFYMANSSTNVGVFVVASGSLGIGTKTPRERFHVKENSWLDGNLTVTGNTVASGTLEVGTVSSLAVQPTYAGANDIPAGILINTNYKNISIIPRGDGLASTAGIYAYNGSSWKSMLESSNESVNSTVRLIKNGGKVAVNTHTADYTISLSGDTSITGNFYASNSGFKTGFQSLTTGQVLVGSNSAVGRFTVSSSFGVVAAFIANAQGNDYLQVWRHPTQKSMWVGQYGELNCYQFGNATTIATFKGTLNGGLDATFKNDNTNALAGINVDINTAGGANAGLTFSATGVAYGIGNTGARGGKAIFTIGGEGGNFNSTAPGNIEMTRYSQGAGNAGEVVEYNRSNVGFGTKWLSTEQVHVWGNFKVANPNTYGGGLGNEILADNLVLSGSGKWTTNADFSLPASGAQFTYSTGTGYISQTAANFRTPLKSNTHYLLTITYSGVAGSPYFVIPDPNGTFHTPVSFQSSQSAWQYFQDIGNTTRYYAFKTHVDNTINGLPFILKAFSAAAGAFKITNISLREITGGTIDTQGTFASGIQTLTASFTAALSAMTWLCNAISGSITASLPSASASYRKMMNVKKIDSTANQIVIKASSSDLIDGATEQKISAQWSSISLHCDGVGWYII